MLSKTTSIFTAKITRKVPDTIIDDQKKYQRIEIVREINQQCTFTVVKAQQGRTDQGNNPQKTESDEGEQPQSKSYESVILKVAPPDDATALQKVADTECRA